MSRILIIEDLDLNRDLLVQMLEDEHELLVAADGGDGLAVATRELPDVILLDLSLPVVDGWEVARRLKQQVATRAIPIIALTAHAMAGDAERAAAAGCDDYVTKPIDRAALLDQIDREHARGVAGGAA